MWKKLGQSYRENKMKEKWFTWKAWAMAQVLPFWSPMPSAKPLQWWCGGGEWENPVNRTRDVALAHLQNVRLWNTVLWLNQKIRLGITSFFSWIFTNLVARNRIEFLKMIFCLQKNCKDGIKSCHVLFTQFLLMLTFYIAMIHLSKLRQ